MFLAGMIPGIRPAPPAPLPSGPRLRDLLPPPRTRANLLGATFGMLRVVAFVRSDGAQKGCVWRCHCAPDLGGCGGMRDVGTRRLNEGRVTHCGHRTRDNTDLTGRTFTLLRVKGIHHKAIRGIVWSCICTCGSVREASTHLLTAKVVQSCGKPLCRARVRSFVRETHSEKAATAT